MARNRTALLCGTTLGILMGVSALAGAAQAQQPIQNSPVASTDETEVQEVVVVGSRIRRDTYNTPAPVQLITREETTLAGFNSPMDVLQSNQVTGGQGQIDNTFGGFVTQGGPGANTIGLRGLSAQRTLVLLNGRRLAPVGTRGAVGSADLNVLPDALVDHIEILKDGASSIYGSDAIAGVINIITKKHVDGLTLEAQYNAPFDKGGEAFRASVSAGTTRGPLELAGSFDYYNRSNLTLGDREWARCNQDLLFNDPTVDLSRADIDPQTGQPKCYPITFSFGSHGVTINTIGTPRTPGVRAVGVPNENNGFVRWRPNSAITSGITGYEAVGSNNLYARDTFSPDMLKQSLISPVTNYVGFGQATLDLSNGAQLYAELTGSRRDSSQVDYRQLSLDYPFLGATTPNPLLPTNLQFGNAFSARQDPDITSGKPIAIRAFIGFGNDYSSQTVQAGKATLGMRGDFNYFPEWLHDWRYDLTGSYQASDADYTFESFIQSRLTNSLNVVATTNSALPTTRGSDNLLYTCAVNVTSPGSNCIPAPLLTSAVVGGNISQAYRDFIFIPVTGQTKYSEAVLTLNMDGPLFKLPAGDLQAAVGVEYRRDHLHDQPPPESIARDLFNFTSAVPSRGDDSVYELYGELEAPILKDLPFAYSWTVNVSGRYTKYKDFDSNTTYKVGTQFSPFRWVTVRGTYGTSYRAPAVFESHQGATSGFQSAQADPCSSYGAKNPTSTLYKNCDADIHNTNFVSNTGITVNTLGGSDLTPETSTNYGFGIILQPKLPDVFGQFQLAVDYYDIDVEDEIGQYNFQTILNTCYNDPAFRSTGGFCDFVSRNGVGQLTINNGYVNISKQIVRGIDYNARYVRDLGPGSVRMNLLVTRYLEQSLKQTPTDDLTDFNGTITQPKYTAQFDTTYSWDKWKVRYGIDWIRKTNSYDLVFGPGADFNNTGFIFQTDDYYLQNLSVQYTEKDWEVVVGIRNLSDKKPPMISAGQYNLIGNTPYFSSTDYLGRTAFVNVSRHF